MNIAIVFERVDPNKGGAETYVVDLCRRLTAAGHDMTLYCRTFRSGALPSRTNVVKVDAAGWPRWLKTWSFASRASRAARSGGHDCVIGLINTWDQDILIPQGGLIEASVELSSRRFPRGWRRSFYTAAKKLSLKYWVCRAIELRQYAPGRNTRVVAVSGLVQGHLERYAGVRRDRIRLIYNAIDAGRLAFEHEGTARASFREQLGLGESELTGLFLAHNFGLKGLGALIQAVAYRKEHNPSARNAKIVVCGGGRSKPFKKLAEKLGVLDQFHFVGFVDDVRKAFAGCDFFILPTYYDPCSLVVFEALACGLPVITTACNGAGEVMTQHVEGIVATTPESTGQLADAIDAMCDDSLRLDMAIRARELGTMQTLEKHVERLIDLCSEVAQQKKLAETRGAQSSPRGKASKRELALAQGR